MIAVSVLKSFRQCGDKFCCSGSHLCHRLAVWHRAVPLIHGLAGRVCGRTKSADTCGVLEHLWWRWWAPSQYRASVVCTAVPQDELGKSSYLVFYEVKPTSTHLFSIILGLYWALLYYLVLVVVILWRVKYDLQAVNFMLQNLCTILA